MDLTNLLVNIEIKSDVRDSWSWTLDDDGRFSVKNLKDLADLNCSERKIQFKKRDGASLFPKKFVFLCGV